MCGGPWGKALQPTGYANKILTLKPLFEEMGSVSYPQASWVRVS